ncbi:hypothetical protein V7S43_003799 [Phytophthora oleae]|uniref:GOLD domain-containing protein n=1 Tax=Phytophthora oleae TaxID=2107226 RepID=A0ABD3FUJ9_9STRA
MGSTAEPNAVVAGSTRAKWSGKKRVRRIQLELTLFRSQVEELELKRKRLKLQQASGNSPALLDDIGTTSVWNAIAERQLRERLRAEKHTTELQASYKGLVDFSTDIQKLLRRSEDSKKELAERVKQEPRFRFQKLTTEADDEIFSEQLTIVSRLYLGLQQQWKWPQTPSSSLHFGLDLSLGEEVVKVDPYVKAGIVLEARSGAILPFTLDVVVMAFWEFLGTYNCIDDTDCSTDFLARSFSLSTNFEGSFSQPAGKYTCRKFATENEATLVWVERADVEEFGGTKFSGMQYLKRGYLKLRIAPREGPGRKSAVTTVETYTETTPIFRDDISNQEEQLQDLVKAVKRSYKTVNAVFCQNMTNILVEEDWKATML